MMGVDRTLHGSKNRLRSEVGRVKSWTSKITSVEVQGFFVSNSPPTQGRFMVTLHEGEVSSSPTSMNLFFLPPIYAMRQKHSW